ncbi:MAG: FkbM family methyltransferase [Acetobacteraceae bacterium]
MTLRESLAQYAVLLFKLFLDRRRFRGPSEFSYRIMRGIRGRHRIRVAARDGAFRATILLRRHTSDLATFEQVFANNAFNLRRLARWREISGLYTRLSGQGAPLVLDLGANVGLASLYFAKNWPKAQIIAVEPEEENYRVMCGNLAEIENIMAVQAAVASEDGAVKIANPDAPAFAKRTELVAHETTGSIAALSVQSLLRMAPQGSLPFIVKIDIEGFESNLFSKNIDWVELFPVVIIEPHDWMLPGQGIATSFLRAIARQDRDFLVVGENVISIANIDYSIPSSGHATK